MIAAVVGGGSWLAAQRIEDQLEQSARTALDDAGIGATVHFDGRDAVLTGLVTSAEDADRAGILVADLAGTRRVVSHLQVGGGSGSSTTPAAPSADRTASAVTPTGAPGEPASPSAPTARPSTRPSSPTTSGTPRPTATSGSGVSAPAATPVLFESNSATLRPDSDNYLKAVVAHLKKSPRTRVTIYGHSDNIGPRPLNRQLSQARADAVAARLIALGVDAARLRTQGFADTRPVASNRTAEGRAANRRVEIVFEGVN